MCDREKEREAGEGGRLREKTSRQALELARVGVKEHQTAGCKERGECMCGQR